MWLRKFLYFLIFIITGSMFICPDYGYSQNGKNIKSVNFEAVAPFSKAELFFTKDDGIIYTFHEDGRETEKRKKAISSAQFQELLQQINKSDFHKLDNKYIDENVDDASYYTITVEYYNSSKKSVTCYAMDPETECPAAFQKIDKLIRLLWNEEIREIGV